MMAKLYSPISFWRAAVCACVALAAWAANAADYPAPKEDSWIAKDFRFHTGEVMPELRINYRPWARRRASRCSSCTARPGRPGAC